MTHIKTITRTVAPLATPALGSVFCAMKSFWAALLTDDYSSAVHFMDSKGCED